MLFKRAIVRKLIDWTASWNTEIHQVIEDKVIAENERTFPPRENDDPKQRDERISDMRAFFYARMSNTASLLMAGVVFIVALIALVVSVIPLFQR